MNTRLLILVGSVLVIVVAIILYLLFGTGKPAQTAQQGQTTTTLPVAGQNPNSGSNAAPSQGMVVSTTGGKAVVVANFLNDPATKADPVNSGYFTLGASGTASPYSITYIASTQYFNVELLQEPIGQTRGLAEQYLLQHLGVSMADLCRLNYMVGTPSSVNSFYGGKSLGFSFCPGATVLPQ